MTSVTARCALALALVALTGCQGSTGGEGEVPAGCGLVDEQVVAGLIGADVTASLHGSIGRLREHTEPLVCTLTAVGRPDRFVRISARHHPDPMDLPRWACDAGHVFAGTPEKYAPACQQAMGSGGRTVLFDREGEYVVTVTVRRSDQNWGGDAEAALRLSRQLAAHLDQS